MNILDRLKDIDNVEIDGIDRRDYPDFCDAFIVHGEIDGRDLTDEELDSINEECSEFVYEYIMDHQLYL